MKMFGNQTTDGLEKQGDRLGGGILETGVYNAVVKMAYVSKSQSSDAHAVNVHLDIDGKEVKLREFVTNRNNENFYLDKKTQKKNLLPGFQTIDDLCLVTTGYGLTEQEMEEKTVRLWDFESRSEVPQNVPVVKDLLGKPVIVALVRQTVNKQVQQGDAYVDSNETRDENIVEKYAHAESGRTVTEITQGLEEGVFIEKWRELNAGKTRDKTTKGKGTPGRPGSGRPNAGGSGDASASRPKSLFNAA